jgi:protoporphyrin/coproporphyrin ferrochelatase
MNKRAVLLMAYGTPESLEAVEAYYTHIRHGRPPAPDQLEDLVERYRAIGGRSPLLEITRAQASALEQELAVPVYVGLKHSAPFISDAVKKLGEDRIDLAVGLVLAPHYSTMSIGDYQRRAHTAASEHGWPGKLEMVESWHLEPDYIGLLADRVTAGAAELGRADPYVLFTAHSLPKAIVEKGDPYPEQLEATARAVVELLGLQSWGVAWQSASGNKSDWLGPDILDKLTSLAGKGVQEVVVCPCGFVADHLEVLYDIDVQAQDRAKDLGLRLIRTASPNADPALIRVLANVAGKALARVA